MSNETILHTFMQDVWNNKNADAIDRYIDRAYHVHLDNADPWEGKTLDHEQYRQRLYYSFHSFPDINFAIQRTIADGDNVAIIWIMTGTHLGTIGDIAPTGRSINTTGMTIYHFNNGKISGHTQVFDRSTVMEQLGFTA